jgi:hypothetical protein
VFGAVDWSALTPAGAFVLGAILATVAVLRVVRAVSVMFGGELHRRRRRPPTPPADDEVD